MAVHAGEALDARPALLRPGDVARDAVRTHDVGRLGPLLGDEARDEGRAQGVDDVVGDDGRHELTTQRVLVEQVTQALDDRGREVGAQVVFEVGVVRQPRPQQRAGETALGVGQQHGQLRALQPAARPTAVGHLLGGGQELDRAVQQALGLQRRHQVLVGKHPRRRAADLLSEHLGLQEGVVEDVGGHVLGDLFQQGVAPGGVELATAHGEVEQDLEVDLVVGAVHAGRVVDEVGVDPPALARRTRSARAG